MTMTIRLRVLWGLRIHGPLSICDLADRTGLERQVAYAAVYRLRRDGLADRLGPASYDVTEQGRTFLAAQQETSPRAARQLGLRFGVEQCDCTEEDLAIADRVLDQLGREWCEGH
jgi:predicted transcriptional regulator